MRVLLGFFCAVVVLGAADSLAGETNQAKPGAPVMQRKGYIIPVRSVLLVSEVSGRILELHCDEGTLVKKDQVLARLDPTSREIDHRHALAMVERARARLIVSNGSLVEKAELTAAEAQRDKTKYLLDQTQIRAPFDGIILTKKAEEGGFLDRRHVNGYYAVCEMADLTQMEVELWIEEANMRLVHVGQKCSVQTDALSKEIHPGVVSRIMPVADRARGAFGVRVRLEPSGKPHNLRPEMSAVVSFLPKE